MVFEIDPVKTWINGNFLVMNLLIPLRVFFTLCRPRGEGGASDIGAIIQQWTACIQSARCHLPIAGLNWAPTY